MLQTPALGHGTYLEGYKIQDVGVTNMSDTWVWWLCLVTWYSEGKNGFLVHVLCIKYLEEQANCQGIFVSKQCVEDHQYYNICFSLWMHGLELQQIIPYI